MQKRISILGATGSIGRNTLDIVAAFPERFKIVAMSAAQDSAGLAELALQFHPELVAIADARKAEDLKARLQGSSIKIVAGPEAAIEAARVEADFTMAAIVGFAGLAPTLEAVKSGRAIGLANKECLVAAGDLFMATARHHDARILPVDSEHNAAFQLLSDIPPAAVKTLTLTASGGPFRTMSMQDLQSVSTAQAIKHPIWSMGQKISVDSATLMNKGLELIEAHHLFSIAPHQLDVIVHPQSVVHAMLSLTDGSVLSHQAPPDMRGPIAFCMGWPERLAPDMPKLDFAEVGKLEFFQPDRDKFRCLALAEAAMQAGQMAPTILNAANEVAVAAFLAQSIGFLQIAETVAASLDYWAGKAEFSATPSTLEEIIALDASFRLHTSDILTKKA